jgi:hypothetical protein
MAKANQQSVAVASDESTSLAERLFTATWNPGSGYTAESIAQKCIEAADAFHRVRRKLDEGRVNEAA